MKIPQEGEEARTDEEIEKAALKFNDGFAPGFAG